MQRILVFLLATAAFVFVGAGCGNLPQFRYQMAGADDPRPDPPIDFAEALRLGNMVFDLTDNRLVTDDMLRARYGGEGIEVVIASTVLPDDDAPSRYMLVIDRLAGVQTLVLAGTNTSFQWQFNLDLAKIYEPSLAAAVHRGFLTATSVIFNDVLPRLEPAYPVDVVGYSLGGAIGCILSQYLLLDGFEVRRIVTFGQPRLTDTAGMSTFAHLPLLRFVNEGDPIPQLSVGDSPHFGAVVVLFNGPYYGFVAADDARLQEAVPSITFQDDFLNKIENHASQAYRDRLRAKIEKSVLLRFP